MSVLSETVDWLTDGDHWSGEKGIPSRLLEHLGYTALTVVIATAIAIPVGLWIGHTGRLRGLAVLSSGALRALPTLGVLVWAGTQSSDPLTPTILSLTLLAIPPLLAGAYAGIESVDPATGDAARAQGMTEWQVLTRVELPLAAPLIVGGVRSATLQVVATATIAAYIGLGGLGRFIIDGQAVGDDARTLGGALLVIALALVLDGIFVLIQRLVTLTRRESWTSDIPLPPSPAQPSPSVG